MSINQIKLFNPPVADGYRDTEAGKQLIHWGSLKWGRGIQPTDVDFFIGLVEFDGKLAVFSEFKRIGAKRNRGQETAFKRVCHAATGGGLLTIYIFARHDVPTELPIPDAGILVVEDYYHAGRIVIPEKPITVKELIDNFLVERGLAYLII